MAGPLHPPQFGDTVLADVDRTIALWVEDGIDAHKIWYELTGTARIVASWVEVKGYMLRWACHDKRAARRDVSR